MDLQSNTQQHTTVKMRNEKAGKERLDGRKAGLRTDTDMAQRVEELGITDKGLA